MARNFRITEKVTLHVRAEFQNVLNRTHLVTNAATPGNYTQHQWIRFRPDPHQWSIHWWVRHLYQHGEYRDHWDRWFAHSYSDWSYYFLVVGLDPGDARVLRVDTYI